MGDTKKGRERKGRDKRRQRREADIQRELESIGSEMERLNERMDEIATQLDEFRTSGSADSAVSLGELTDRLDGFQTGEPEEE